MELLLSSAAFWVAAQWEHILAVIGFAAFIANKLPPKWRDDANATIKFITWLLDQVGHNYGNTVNAGTSAAKK